jgi:hypothetical protein
MFETYINGLRLLRRRASQLDPNAFFELETVRDTHGKLATCSGWSLWAGGAGTERIGLLWHWGFIQYDIPAIDPMRIQTNLLLLDDSEHMISEYQAVGALVNLINHLRWQDHARAACGDPGLPP